MKTLAMSKRHPLLPESYHQQRNILQYFLSDRNFKTILQRNWERKTTQFDHLLASSCFKNAQVAGSSMFKTFGHPAGCCGGCWDRLKTTTNTVHLLPTMKSMAWRREADTSLKILFDQKKEFIFFFFSWKGRKNW